MILLSQLILIICEFLGATPLELTIRHTKSGEVLLHYKSFLPKKSIDVNYLNKCISFELRTGLKVCKFLPPYRSASQNRDEFGACLSYDHKIYGHMADKNP